MADRQGGWDWLEDWLRQSFHGLVRKGGTEDMAAHSIRVGRRLLADGEDPITVFGGYCHDVLEDVGAFKSANPSQRRALLMPVAMRCLGGASDASDAVALAEACCYSDGEYALPKADRKAAACLRWLDCGDIRVWLIKRADVDDNHADCHAVSAEFALGYEAWALPLRTGLCERIAGRRGAAAGRPAGR